MKRLNKRLSPSVNYSDTLINSFRFLFVDYSVNILFAHTELV